MFKTRFWKIIIGFFIVAFLALSGFLIYQKYHLLIPKLQNVTKQADNILTPGPLSGPNKPTRAKSLDPNEIIKWTNYYRTQNNLSPLAENELLAGAATAKVNDMLDKQYFAHVSPDGKSVTDLLAAEGYQYKLVGENLALGDFQNEKDLVDAWMASPGHRANILKPDYKEIGMATKLDKYEGRTTWMAVQTFGTVFPKCQKPSANLKSEIDQKQNISTQANSLYQEGNSLVELGNQKIAQGNEIYKETGDKTAAQPYWDEGADLQKQGQDKINQAKSMQSQINDLSSLMQRYNTQVADYNACLG